MDVTMSPPAPIPCSARIPTSHVMFSARPHRNEPITKMPVLTWKTSFRPNRSPNFPASAAAIVSVSRYAVTTQDRCPAPPSSPTIVGSAVETIVWSSAARNMPSRTVPNTTLIWRRDSSEDVTHPASPAWPQPPCDPPPRRQGDAVTMPLLFVATGPDKAGCSCSMTPGEVSPTPGIVGARAGGDQDLRWTGGDDPDGSPQRQRRRPMRSRSRPRGEPAATGPARDMSECGRGAADRAPAPAPSSSR